MNKGKDLRLLLALDVSKMTREQKIAEILKRFKVRRDLYDYLTNRLHWRLPAYKHSSMKFMQSILFGHKKVFTIESIPNVFQAPPPYSEFSSKTLMTDGFITSEEVEMYLPSNKPDKVDRQFTFDIFKALKYETATCYYNKILDEKMGSRLPKMKNNELKLNDDTLDLLLKYDHMPVRNVKQSYLQIDFTLRKPPQKKIKKVIKKRTLADFVQGQALYANDQQKSKQQPVTIKKFKQQLIQLGPIPTNDSALTNKVTTNYNFDNENKTRQSGSVSRNNSPPKPKKIVPLKY